MNKQEIGKFLAENPGCLPELVSGVNETPVAKFVVVSRESVVELQQMPSERLGKARDNGFYIGPRYALTYDVNLCEYRVRTWRWRGGEGWRIATRAYTAMAGAVIVVLVSQEQFDGQWRFVADGATEVKFYAFRGTGYKRISTSDPLVSAVLAEAQNNIQSQKLLAEFGGLL